MNGYLTRVKAALIIAFFALVAIFFVYDQYWVGPGRACEAAHNWWDPKTRICGHTIWIPDITHRPIQSRQQKPWDQIPQKVR